MPHRGRLHFPHFRSQVSERKGEEVGKGWVAVDIKEGEEQKRCVVRVEYINHPFFQKLLKEAEEEYGFDYEGRIAIPCNFSDFQYVQEVIEREIHETHRQGHVSCFGL